MKHRRNKMRLSLVCLLLILFGSMTGKLLADKSTKILWGGVSAEDRFQWKTIDIKIEVPSKDILCAPFGYSLLPVDAKYSTMDTFNWRVKNLLYDSNNSLEIMNVPISGAPYVIKYIRKLK